MARPARFTGLVVGRGGRTVPIAAERAVVAPASDVADPFEGAPAGAGAITVPAPPGPPP